MIHREEAESILSAPVKKNGSIDGWDSLLDDLVVIASIIESSLYARDLTKRPTCALHPPALLMSLQFYRCGDGGPERSCNFPKST